MVAVFFAIGTNKSGTNGSETGSNVAAFVAIGSNGIGTNETAIVETTFIGTKMVSSGFLYRYNFLHLLFLSYYYIILI